MPKPGKTDYGIAKVYGPISLTLFLLKELEKFDRYLRIGPLVSVPIHPRQLAFRAGKSTERARVFLPQRSDVYTPIKIEFGVKEYTMVSLLQANL